VGLIQDVLDGIGPSDTALTYSAALPVPPDYNPVLGFDPADYTHLGATTGSVYDDSHATLTVRGIHQAASVAVAESALKQALPFPFGILAAAGLESTMSGIVLLTDKFLITSATEPRAARAAMVMSFNQPSVYSAGMRPYVFRYAGHVLINQLDGDGRNRFYAFYRKYLRASAGLVGRDRRAFPWLVELKYRDMLRTGYVSDLGLSINALDPSKGDMNFTMFVVADSFV